LKGGKIIAETALPFSQLHKRDKCYYQHFTEVTAGFGKGYT